MKTKRVTLFYASVNMRHGIKARAVAVARVTKTLLIVQREHVQIIESKGPTFGPPELRFDIATGRTVGRKSRWRVEVAP